MYVFGCTSLRYTLIVLLLINPWYSPYCPVVFTDTTQCSLSSDKERLYARSPYRPPSGSTVFFFFFSFFYHKAHPSGRNIACRYSFFFLLLLIKNIRVCYVGFTGALFEFTVPHHRRRYRGVFSVFRIFLKKNKKKTKTYFSKYIRV